MQSLHTKDLIEQRDQVRNEIKMLESKLTESRMKLGIFESAVLRSETIDKEQPHKETATKTSSSNSFTQDNLSVEQKIIILLQGKVNESARASEITDELGEGNRDINKKIYAAMNNLGKQGTIQVIKEYDSTGSERQRNRLYQLTALV